MGLRQLSQAGAGPSQAGAGPSGSGTPGRSGPATPRRGPLGVARPDFARAPVTVAWEVTRACPLRCVHCRAEAQPRRHPDELSTAEGRHLIADAAAMGARVMVITGGDPLARPDTMELLGAVRDAGMHAGFSPSATARLTPATLARAVEAGAGTIHLSLDGDRPETHDGFRRVRGSHRRTTALIEAAVELGVRVQVGTAVSRRTVEELPLLAEHLPRGIALWSLFFLVPTGRAARDDLLSAAEHEAVLTWLSAVDLPFSVRTIAAPAFTRVLAQAGGDPLPSVTDGNGMCFVSHTGAVFPSGFLQVPVGNVRAAPLRHWYRHSPLFVALRDKERLEGRCGRCEYRLLCGGSRARAWAMTGNPFAEEPTCAYEPAVAS